ncbi:MAG: DUF2192 domain-containing protein [Acidilobaceae archaeon]
MNKRKIVDVKRRINILMEVWQKIIEMWEESGGALTRDDIIRVLSEAYEREKISPIKGASNPKDLYDKELTSLYVVGKYGMALDEEYPDLFDKIFVEEYKYENAISILLSDEPHKAKERIKVLMGKNVDDNVLARVLRTKMVQVYFGFDKDESFLQLINKLREAFPEREKVISNYAKFYVAFKIAETISKGEIRDKITKEAVKHALALELGLTKKKLPDDNYIKAIAIEVFRVDPKTLQGVLGSGKSKERSSRFKKFRGERTQSSSGT